MKRRKTRFDENLFWSLFFFLFWNFQTREVTSQIRREKRQLERQIAGNSITFNYTKKIFIFLSKYPIEKFND
jgi:hypothetical protein